MNKRFLRSLSLVSAFLIATATATSSTAAEYKIDDGGKHAFIQFKVNHLGYSYLLGDFPDFTGSFTYDAENPGASKVDVSIDTASVDTRHAKRNVHIRSADFLDVKKYPKASFVSTSYEESGNGNAVLNGDLTLHGVTKPVALEVTKIGEGKDPWGNYRAGFEGSTTITMSDFGMNYDLGEASRTVEIYVSIEGIQN